MSSHETTVSDKMENIILKINEARENIERENLLHYCTYRYTFLPNKGGVQQVDEQKEIFDDIWRFIDQHYNHGEKMIGGIEHHTKGYIPAKPHIHIHFATRSTGDTIRHGLARHFPKYYTGRCQSASMDVITNDEDKFYRYPLKQQKGESKVAYKAKGFTKEKVEQMVDVAHECWIAAAQVFINKLEKKAERTSEDRLFNQLDAAHEVDPFGNYRKVLRFAMAYYLTHEPTFNRSTITGYVDKWVLKRSIMTYDEYMDLYNVPNFTFRK